MIEIEIEIETEIEIEIERVKRALGKAFCSLGV